LDQGTFTAGIGPRRFHRGRVRNGLHQRLYHRYRAIAILAIAALAAFAVREEWLNLIVGLWALVSPWVLGFQGTTAMTVHVIIGAAVAILAAIELDDAPDPTAADHRPLRG
jgi:SPW repeat